MSFPKTRTPTSNLALNLEPVTIKIIATNGPFREIAVVTLVSGI
jgi:hypothetical protein